MQRYSPKEIEPKWQKIWEEQGLYKTDTTKFENKLYVIPMFPYPSGDLHVGHWYNFVPTDTVARWHRMRGYNVLHCNGFDSFGLPAENAAIKRGIPPAKWTEQNIDSMSKQIKSIGASYDWDRKLITSDPEYYKWTQWLFIQLYKHGQAYKKKALVNWCPKDQTVLANEQTIGEDGTKNVCVRCGTKIEHKELEQWYFKITDYADRLLDDADELDMPDRVKSMQENWIGRSKGAEVDFAVDGSSDKIRVFTTRVDTLFGTTYLILAPEHDLVSKITTQDKKDEIKSYVDQALSKTELDRKEGEKEKSGVFTGAYAINPINNEKIPIWVADYVLMSYGTGAIMAVPAHDERDFEFAEKFNLPIREVVAPDFGDPLPNAVDVTGPVVIGYDPSTKRFMSLINTKHNMRWLVAGGLEDGESYRDAALRELKEEGGFTKVKKLIQLGGPNYSYFYNSNKDSNRRSFSYMFLAILDEKDAGEQELEAHEKYEVVWSDLKSIQVDFENEPSGREHWIDGLQRVTDAVKALEADEEYQGPLLSGEGILFNSGTYSVVASAVAREKIVEDLMAEGLAREKTNFKMRDWLISRQRYWGAPIPVVYCDNCGLKTVSEQALPVLLPEDVEFTPTGKSPLLGRDDFVNTECPECGGPAKRETDTMDTFVDSSWYYLRYPTPDLSDKPFDTEIINRWGPLDHYIGGIEHAILHLLYARYITKFLHDNYGLSFNEPFKKLSNQGIILGPDGDKMSKSKGNVVSPDEQLGSYGADALRLYLMFMGPYDQGGPYSFGGIAGTRRFLDRLWTLCREFIESEGNQNTGSNPNDEILKIANKAVKSVSEDLHSMQFNTAISAMMEAVNSLYKFKNSQGFSDKKGWSFALNTMVKLLAPFAPHIAEELWQNLGREGSVHVSKWPMWDDKLLQDEKHLVVIQINGKVRSQIEVDKGIDEESVKNQAFADEKIKSYIEGKEIKRTVYVPGKLINVVLNPNNETLPAR